MAFVNKRGEQVTIALSRKESAESGLEEGKRYDILKGDKGQWLIVESKERQSPDSAENRNPGKGTEQSIIELLAQASLKQRVEGEFEKMLDKQGLVAFKKMLSSGEVVPFKLNKNYKKAVYKAREEVEGEGKGTEGKELNGAGAAAAGKAGEGKPSLAKKESEKKEAGEKQTGEYCLEKDGFLVCRNDERVKALSQQYREDIEKGNIKGIKSFEGTFYIIDGALYDKYKEKVLSAARAGDEVRLPQLAEKVGISSMLVKIVCEFLKEEGELIEKRKELFKAV